MAFHFAWRLLYTKFCFLFDFATECVSRGRWKAWARTSIPYLQRRRILELGHGPGHLLIALRKAGYQPTGIDLSPGMARLAARELQRAGVDVPLVRCQAQMLPFRAKSFDDAVATFPTDDILKWETLQEVARVIPQGGRLIMVVGAQRQGTQPNPHFIDWLKGLTGQNVNGAERMPSIFCRAGLRPRIEYQSVRNSPVFLLVAEKRQRQDGWVNIPPTVDAGANIRILSRDQSTQTLSGKATDADGDFLTSRWLAGETVLSDWKAVGADGKVFLELWTLPPLPVGKHTLTLEVFDTYETATDTMILTVENSPPEVIPIGEGTYEVKTSVALEAQVSDHDGDYLNFSWFEGTTVLSSGSIQAVKLGNPMNLTGPMIGNLSLGTHALTLRVSDGVNPPVSADMTVFITDTTPPRLAPVADKTVLWPPDHTMVGVMINANASDNSGMPVVLSVSVFCNEPETGLGEWDIGPDWSDAEIDQGRGVIALQLRAERSEWGNGRRYTVTITGRDPSGNVGSADIKILVPREHREYQ